MADEFPEELVKRCAEIISAENDIAPPAAWDAAIAVLREIGYAAPPPPPTQGEERVEEIVERCETYEYSLPRDEQRALIASWRERGEALEDFVKWSEAYPTTIFVEPDYEKAHALLQAGGMTLDAISAGVMREATREIGKRARAVLAAEPASEDKP